MKFFKVVLSLFLLAFLICSLSCNSSESKTNNVGPISLNAFMKSMNMIQDGFMNTLEKKIKDAKVKERINAVSNHIAVLDKDPNQGSSGKSGSQDPTEQLLHDKYKMIYDQLEQQEAQRQHDIDMKRVALRIDIYYAHLGSPMQGTGAVYAQQWEQHPGISPYLSAAISVQESAAGKICYGGQGSCNAWGMLGYGFIGSFQQGIADNFDYLNKNYYAAGNPCQTGSDIEFGLSTGIGPYCVLQDQVSPNSVYAGGVDAVVASIQGECVDNLISDLSETPPVQPNNVVQVAKAQLGKPYVYGAVGPDSFDCSGLVTYCYMNGDGKCLPRTSYDQAHCGTPVDASQLQPGDILGFDGWDHVGIYEGNGIFIQAPHTGDVVKETPLASRSDLCGAVRP